MQQHMLDENNYKLNTNPFSENATFLSKWKHNVVK